MIKHLKIFARGLREMWGLWLIFGYFILAYSLGKVFGSTIVIVMLGAFVLLVLVGGVYAVGKGVSK